MPVVEYKTHVVSNRGAMAAPLWVEDGGYHRSPIDHTMVGWVLSDSDREYYVPDTVIELTKSSFIDRQMAIHAIRPFDKEPDSNGLNIEDPGTMDSSEVVTFMGTWYDNFVSGKS